MPVGRLKERDPLFELVLKWITQAEWDMTLTLREALAKAESLIDEHFRNPSGSELSRTCPQIGQFYTRLPLVRALDHFSKKVSVEVRRFVPPTFSEVRQVFNLAQVLEMREKIKMLTFDADDTLYEHGLDMEASSWMVDALVQLLKSNIFVAVVTAAGYPGKPERYQARLKGLLERMRESKLPKDVTDRFYCMGGECNYLFRITDGYMLEEVDPDVWMTTDMKAWKPGDVAHLLDIAETSLKDACTDHRLDVQYIRKARAVGCYPTRAECRIPYEALEDIALTVQDALITHPSGPPVLPFCAFNGNRDVWVDIGDKRIGIEALQSFLNVSSQQSCHLGDRFTKTGNDMRARDIAMTVWVTSPSETEDYLELFLSEMGSKEAGECAAARPHGPKQGTIEWQKAQTIQRNTAGP